MIERLTTQSKVIDGMTLKALCESGGEDGCDSFCEEYQENNCKGCPVQKAFNSLAAYEDSGLSPEEVILLKKKGEKTNADRIRSMTDEELANLLSTAWNKADYEDDDYDPAWLEWLRLPVEQEGIRCSRG